MCAISESRKWICVYIYMLNLGFKTNFRKHVRQKAEISRENIVKIWTIARSHNFAFVL